MAHVYTCETSTTIRLMNISIIPPNSPWLLTSLYSHPTQPWICCHLICLYFLEKKKKKNQIVCTLFCMASFSPHNFYENLSMLLHVLTVHFYCWVQYSIIWIYDYLFIYAPTDQYLGCFQFSGIIKKAMYIFFV